MNKQVHFPYLQQTINMHSMVELLVLSVYSVYVFVLNFIRVNHLDIAPPHASVLMGYSNTFATVPGIISPALTGYIVTNSVGVSAATPSHHHQLYKCNVCYSFLNKSRRCKSGVSCS